MVWKTLIVAFMATGVLAQDIPNVTDQQREQYAQMLEAHCKKLGAEDKAKDVQNAIRGFVDCLKGIFDLQTIKNEIEDAKPKGELDEVFKRYCDKSSQAKTCISTLLEGIKPCVDPVALDNYGPFLNTTNRLIDFVCHKDGERIALFIAYNGGECFKDKADDLKKCFENVRKSIPNLEAAKAMSVEDKCSKYDELTTCTVTALEKCDNPTPANMAESLLKFIRKGSSCDTALPKD